MKVFKREIGNGYVVGFIAAAYFLLGNSMEKFLFETFRPEPSIYELRTSEIRVDPKGNIDHPNPLFTEGIFSGKKKSPTFAFIYGTKEKMNQSKWDMIMVSPKDDGRYIKIGTSEKCRRCHKAPFIPQTPKSDELNKYKISM